METRRLEGANSLRVAWAGFADYRFEVSGTEATVDVVLDGADEREATLGFLISVLPLALPLLDLEALHGAAVMGPVGQVVLILGDAGVGKSTLANELSRIGWRVMSDDACALDLDGRLYPGPPVFSVHDERREPDGLEYADKQVFLVEEMPEGPLDVTGIAILERGGGWSTRRLRGEEAFSYTLRYARAPQMFADRRRRIQLKACAGVATSNVTKIEFAEDRPSPAELAGTVATWFDEAG